MSQKLTPYQLGIVYSIGSLTDGRWVFRYSDKYFLEQVQFCNSIYSQMYKGKIQYVLKMPENVIDLSEHNYTSRNSDQRDIPVLDREVDYKDFVRAYVEIHGKLDIRNAISYGKKVKALRLRIYGNNVMMNSISRLLNEYVDVGIKKVGNAVNSGKTGILYYQSREEIEKIFDWCGRVDEGDGISRCEKYWNSVEEIMREI